MDVILRIGNPFCIPGARLHDIEEAADLVVDRNDRNTLFVLHAGTNNVQSVRTEDILAKYRRMIRRYKDYLIHILASGILPIINACTGFHRKASTINVRLGRLCQDEEVSFTNAWDHFYDNPDLFPS